MPKRKKYTMDWIKLLSLRKQSDREDRPRKEQDKSRSGFEVDYDRVVFSPEFRSLQDKTQVIPLSKVGFAHTRLTHSLEVSVVGRSLGNAIGQEVISRDKNLEKNGYKMTDFGSIVSAASLAHDIGNPPFGHLGEKAIQDFFKTKKGKEIEKHIDQWQYSDLCNFEGNANGWRILTETRAGKNQGFRLSFATLGAFIKYPKSSLEKGNPKDVAHKKYNFFCQDKDAFLEVAQTLQLENLDREKYQCARHPLAFLVEAADDICYTIIDLEDGVNLGLIGMEEAHLCLMELVEKKINYQKYAELEDKANKIAYLRALSIGSLVEDAKQVFLDNEREILNGNFKNSLLEVGKYKDIRKQIIDKSVEKIYCSQGVMEKEIGGYSVLQNILEIYFEAVVNQFQGRENSYDRLVLKTIPKIYTREEDCLYRKILSVVCYLSSLTDTQITQKRMMTMGII